MTVCKYRSGTVNSNTVNSKFHLIRSYCEIFFYHFPNISCLKCTVNSNFHLIRSKTLPTNDFELTVPNLYVDRKGSAAMLADKNSNQAVSIHRHYRSGTLKSNTVKPKFHLYRLGTVNSKSFVGKHFLQNKWKYELTMYFKHEMIGK